MQTSHRSSANAGTEETRNIPPGDEGLNATEHVDGRLVQLHEHSGVDLAETEKLQDLTRLGCNVVDTTDTHNERHLCLGLAEEVASLGGGRAHGLEGVLLGLVLLLVLHGALHVLTTLGACLLHGGGVLLEGGSLRLGGSGLSLLLRLGDGHGTGHFVLFLFFYLVAG